MPKFVRVAATGALIVAAVGTALVIILACTVGADFGTVPDWIAAFGAVGTLVVALAAAGYAFSQVQEARQLRLDQARPFVVVDFEPSPVGHPFMDLVIQNIGTTLAQDVRITFDPPLKTTFDKDSGPIPPLAGASLFAHPIPSIPPGKRYAVLFDHMPDRFNRLDLTRRYRVNVELSGPHGKEAPTEQVIDLDLYYNTQKVAEYGTHHIAKTLRAWAKKNGVRSF